MEGLRVTPPDSAGCGPGHSFGHDRRIPARGVAGSRRRTPLAVVVLVVVVLALGSAGPAPAAPAQQAEPGKVLVVTAPALRWADLVEHDLPNLEGWLADASVAMLSLRTLGARTGIGQGYVPIGPGHAPAGTAHPH